MSEPVRYRERPWPPIRNAVESVLEQHRPHTVYGFGEVDVTEPLEEIARLRREERLAVSFHAFAIHALARAAAENPGVLTYRRGRKLLTFEDADVATTIEKHIHGVRIPAVHTIRAAQARSLAQICAELRHAIRTDMSSSEEVRLRRAVTRLPRPLRRLVGWRLRRDPLLLRRFHGNIGITTVAEHGIRLPFFALPPNIHTYTLALGTVGDRVEPYAGGGTRVRKVLFLAGGADHLVIDGMGLARFGQRLFELLGSAEPLRGGFADELRRLTRERPA